MKATLVVKNIGPIKEATLDVRNVMTFIGPQASGKSTLAKIIAICRNRSLIVFNFITFKELAERYNLPFTKQSYFSYKTDFYSLEFKNGKLKVGNTFYKKIKELEDNLEADDYRATNEDIALINKILDSGILNNSGIISMLSSILTIEFTSYNNFIDKIKSYIIKQKNRDSSVFKEFIAFLGTTILSKIVDDDIYVPAERNFIPLILNYTTSLLNNKVPLPFYLLEFGSLIEKAREKVKKIPLSIIGDFRYKYINGQDRIYHSQKGFVELNKSSSGIQSVVPLLLSIEYYKTNDFFYRNSFVVEEPEINLYPKAQLSLVKELLKECYNIEKFEEIDVISKENNLIITTHSPYILASLNNSLYAYTTAKKNKDKIVAVEKIIPKESWLNPKDCNVYSVANGTAKSIFNKRTGLIKENEIDQISDQISDEFDALMDIQMQ